MIPASLMRAEKFWIRKKCINLAGIIPPDHEPNFTMTVLLLVFLALVERAVHWTPDHSRRPSLPVWVKLMYADIRMFMMSDSAFQEYYPEHPFSWNLLYRYYMRWKMSSSSMRMNRDPWGFRKPLEFSISRISFKRSVKTGLRTGFSWTSQVRPCTTCPLRGCRSRDSFAEQATPIA